MDYLKAGYEFHQLKRPSPAAKEFGAARRERLEEYVKEYMRFLVKSRIPTEVVNNVVEIARSAGFVAGYNEQNPKPFFVTSRNANAFALVHPGRGSHRLNRGLRVILTHVDSPSLKLKPSPTLLEGPDEDTALTSGVLLDAEPYGSIDPTQWFGRNLKLIGEFFSKGKRRKLEIPVYSSIYSLHLKDEEAKFSENDLRIVTGIQSVKELYDFFGIEGELDFSTFTTHIVPNEEPIRIAGGDYITGYGHDGRACVYAAVKAIVESNPTSPSFVFGFDKEEIGSSGTDTGYFGFFRRVISETVTAVSKERKVRSLEDLMDRNLLRGVPVIAADADAGSTFFEYENENVDPGHIAKFIHGPFVYAHESPEGNIVRAKSIDYLVTLFRETLGKTEKIASDRFQVIGNPLKPKSGEAGGTLADIFAKQNIPLIVIGPPVGGLHNPVEIINTIDIYWTIQAYKAYIRERPSFRGGGKRKID